MLNTKTLVISAIKDGTVIDHIPAGKALYILRLLKLSHYRKHITLALNLKSHSMGYKDIIKLEECFLNESESEKVALFAPKATLNLIQNFEVMNKLKLKMPEKIMEVFSCQNERCISNHESVPSHLIVDRYGQKTRFCCHYCKKYTSQEEAIYGV